MTQEWHLSRPPVARFQHLYDGARADGKLEDLQ
jgi:hypothetical protein